MVSETKGRSGGAGEALLVQSAALVAALSSQFESSWERAAPMGAPTVGGVPLRDGRILRGLAQGLRDRDIAVAAMCSVATVERTTAAYRERWYVDSRAALAVEAARRGWALDDH